MNLSTKFHTFIRMCKFITLPSFTTRVDPTHPVFDIEEPLPAEYMIEVASTQRALQKVKCRKATGPDNIPPWMVTNYAHLLAAPVTGIFNSSLREGKATGLGRRHYNSAN